LAVLPQIAWGNAANSLLERTLDDSANRRTLIPEAFLISDELLLSSSKLVRGMEFDPDTIHKNLQTYAPFAASERVLMALARAGADRQVMHERLRNHALAAWEAVQKGNPNSFLEHLSADGEIGRFLSKTSLAALMNIEGYTGLAAQRAQELADRIRTVVKTAQK